MKTLRRPTLYLILTALVATVPAAALAAHRPGLGPGVGPGPGGRPGGPFGGGPMGGPMASRMAGVLGLSDDQRDQIRAIHDGYRDQAEALNESLKDARVALGDRIHADPFDETAIRQAAQGLAALEADLAVLRARISSEVRQVLTPEQVEQARGLRERMREFAGERGGHHRRGERGPFSPPSGEE